LKPIEVPQGEEVFHKTTPIPGLSGGEHSNKKPV
jgi:hypothetical protein